MSAASFPMLGSINLASFFEGQVMVASGHDSTFLHFFASELSSFLGRNASCCDFKQLIPRLAGVALHGGTGVQLPSLFLIIFMDRQSKVVGVYGDQEQSF